MLNLSRFACNSQESVFLDEYRRSDPRERNDLCLGQHTDKGTWCWSWTSSQFEGLCLFSINFLCLISAKYQFITSKCHFVSLFLLFSVFLPNRAISQQNWELAARHIAKVANGPKIVIEKSTLPVHTAHSMVRDIIICSFVFQFHADIIAFCAAGLQKRVLNSNERKIQFEILSNPEFLAEGMQLC